MGCGAIFHLVFTFVTDKLIRVAERRALRENQNLIVNFFAYADRGLQLSINTLHYGRSMRLV